VRAITINSKTYNYYSYRDSMLSEAERQFLKDVINDNTKKYSSNYKYVLKHRILNKRRTLTDDLLLVNAALDKLQSF